MRRSLLILTVLLFMPAIGFSQTTWYVPDDFSTIRDAILDIWVVNGDTVIVRAGTYVENINFLGKGITLKSELGPNVTIINGNQAESVVICKSGENADSVLDGFTITNGNPSSYYGGGMKISYSNPTVTNCTFTGNSSSGMFNSCSNPTVTDCTFTGNSGFTGGMWNSSSNPTVTDCTFIGNTGSIGGGMYNSGCSPTVTNCTFTGNTANGSAPTPPGGFEWGGGGMANHSSTPTVTNCTFSNNLASGGRGGGMLNWGSNTNPTVTDCTFSGNTAQRSGGGMFNYGSSPTVTNCTFDGNSAPDDYYDGVGGGMSNGPYSSPTVTNCTFTGNSAYADGGGMYNDSSNSTVTSCTFTGNSATSNYINSRGGGMFNKSGNPTVTSCNFTGNWAEFFGGGMFNESCGPTVTNCTFSGNSGNTRGGGMYNIYGDPTVTNCTFSGNSGGFFGGGIHNEHCSPMVTNCTFTGNSVYAGGGGMFNEFGSPTVTNCIFWNDTTDEIFNASGSSPTVTYSCVQGGYPGTGNIDADPLFVDPVNGDFHLTYPSPCKDTGDNTAVTELYDFESDPRIAYGTVDMGVDEFYPHLYYTGDAIPTGNVEIKFIGLPGDLINGLLIGINIFDPPLLCDYGLWYMDNPFQIMTGFGAIPSDGVKVFPGTIPASTPSPMTVYLQAAIDSWLTNLCTVQVQ